VTFRLYPMICLILTMGAGSAVWWSMTVPSTVAAAETRQFGDRVLCRFDGRYKGRMPVAIVETSDTDVIHPLSDIYNRYIVSEGAKPFHFGVIVEGDASGEPEAWGWSYRSNSYWKNIHGGFALAKIPSELSDRCLRQGRFSRR
jgi:hypothetical protein